MVMRNRREEPGWWDDLPPKIRERFSAPDEPSDPEPASAKPSRGLAWLRESSLFAILMLAVALTNLFFLLLVFALVDRAAINH